MMFINVDLPDPDAPITATKSRGSTANDTSRSARTSTSPIWYVFETVFRSMSATATLEHAAHATRGRRRGRRRSAATQGRVGHHRVTRLHGALQHLRQRTIADAGADREGLQHTALVQPHRALVVGVVAARARRGAAAGALTAAAAPPAAARRGPPHAGESLRAARGAARVRR